MSSKFSKQEQEKFLKDLENIALESDSELEDSFFEKETKRMQTEIDKLRNQKDLSVLQQLKKNVHEEDQMITEYEKERDELHKITSNETKNVIGQQLISAIKEKVAAHANSSQLVLADEQYNQSLLTQQNQPEPLRNNSFLKNKQTAKQKIQAEEAILAKKIEAASQQRELLAMEREDKLSFKFQMQCLSDIFKHRFTIPKYPRVVEQDQPIKLIFTKLPPSFVRLTPQVVSEETVMPKNSPEIALKQLRQTKKKAFRPSSSVQIKVSSKKIQPQSLEFQQISIDKNNPGVKKYPIDQILTQYISNIKPLVTDIEKIANQYHPRFLRYLQEEEKNFNYEVQAKEGNQRNVTQVASTENVSSLCQLKLSFEKLTSLKGVQHFLNLEEAQFQFNLISSIQPLHSCAKLIELNLSQNKIKNAKAINALQWLRLLNIEHNLLQILSPQCKSLQALFASHNRIQEIDLEKSKQLRIVQLNYNKIHSIPKLKLLGLEQLGLSHNQLSSTEGTQQLILLKKLDLASNRIAEIDKLTFLYLNELNLSGNGLSSLKDLFLPCLQSFHLNDNRLIGKGQGTAFLPNLKELNIDDNRLEGFGCIWWLLRFSKGAEIIRYGNNEYFLSLREKVREVYEALLYKEFFSLKILNDSPADRGLSQYYKENYSIYFAGSTFFQQSDPSLMKIQAIIRLLLRESTFSRLLESKNDPFSKEQAYIDYQWSCKVASLRQVIELNQNAQKPLIVPPTLFHRYDVHQTARRNLFHRLRGALLTKMHNQAKKIKHFQKLRPTIILLLQRLYSLHLLSQKKKSISKFAFLLRKLNETQAAIKIQKIWRGYVRRKLYHKLKQRRQQDAADSDVEDVDIDFFNNQLEKHQFDIDLEGFEDIIIRPEVFQLIEAKQKDNAQKQIKKAGKGQKEEEKPPLNNNFLDSRTKLNKPSKKEEEKEGEAERMMKEWRITDPRVLKALQYKQQKKEQMRKKQRQKNMTASERFQRFKKGGY